MSDKRIVQKVVVAAVIIKDNKILVVQRNKNEAIFPNMWELPSGRKEFLESTTSSLVRETKEETGLDVEIIVPLFVFDYQVEKDGEVRDSTQINFLVKLLDQNQEVKLSLEHQDFAWVRVEEIDDYNFTAATKKVISRGFDLISKFL